MSIALAFAFGGSERGLPFACDFAFGVVGIHLFVLDQCASGTLIMHFLG